MKKLILATLLCLFAIPAMGQTKSFVHDFGDYKVYQTFGKLEATSFVQTSKVVDNVCKKTFTLPVEFKGGKIIFSEDTAWQVKSSENGIYLKTSLNDNWIAYAEAEIDPMELCAMNSRDI
jgi:hypothetical protein